MLLCLVAIITNILFLHSALNFAEEHYLLNNEA